MKKFEALSNKENLNYQIIDSIRFNKELEKEIVQKILTLFKEKEESIKSSNNSESILEDYLVGGTTYLYKDPLTPAGLISGNVNTERISSRRLEIRQMTTGGSGFYAFARGKNKVNFDSGRIDLEVDKTAQKKFASILNEIKSKTEKDPVIVYCKFDHADFDARTHKIQMPHLKGIKLMEEHEILYDLELPNELSQKIKLKAFKFDFNQYNKEIGSKVNAFVDKDGWRFEKK